MRKHVLIAVCAFILCGCATHRKIAETVTQRTDSTANKTFDSVGTSHVITDTSTTETGQVIITEIKFGDDTTGHDANQVTIGKDGAIHATGNIRHVRQSESGYQVKKNGMTERTDSTAVKSTANTDRHTTTNRHKEPAKDPKRWRYIAIIIVSILVAVILFMAYWKRSSIRAWFIDFFAKLRRK